MDTRTVKQQRLASIVGQQASLADRLAGLSTPALGPDFGDLSGPALADALVVHRLTKHFGGLESITPKQRRRRTIRNMINYDKQGLTAFDYRTLPQPLRGQALMAKERLASFFKGMKRTHKFRAPTGETSESAGGHVDLMFKIIDEQQWRVSLEAAPEAAAVAWHNVLLKREVKRRFKAKYPMWRAILQRMWTKSDGAFRGFTAFKHMFLNVCIIQNYSRLSTVKKNAFTDRPISMEPMWNMIAQLSYARDLRAHLLSYMGIDLDTLASLHCTLIRHAEIATVDFSNASNSNWVAVLRFLLPKKVCDKLLSLRTPICFYEGEFHYYNMLAPMGCGFTFEVMTIVLLHLGRAICPSTSVFGDDVIIQAPKAEAFIALTVSLGWKINTEKTFVKGNFRESCGGFHDLSTKRDLVSYEMHEVTDEFEACTLANKLYRILEARQISAGLREVLYNCYRAIIKALPSDVYRVACEVFDDIPSGVVIVDDEDLLPFNGSQVSVLASQQLHTKMRVGRAYVYRLDVADIKSLHPNTELLCYLYRGSSYKPTVRNTDKLSKTVVFATGNGSLATVPLLSFI